MSDSISHMLQKGAVVTGTCHKKPQIDCPFTLCGDMTAAVTVELLNTQGHFPRRSQMVHYPIITNSRMKEKSQLKSSSKMNVSQKNKTCVITVE